MGAVLTVAACALNFVSAKSYTGILAASISLGIVALVVLFFSARASHNWFWAIVPMLMASYSILDAALRLFTGHRLFD